MAFHSLQKKIIQTISKEGRELFSLYKQKKNQNNKKERCRKETKAWHSFFPSFIRYFCFSQKKKEKKNLGNKWTHSLFFERKSMFIPLKNFLLINPFLKSFNPLSITRYLYKIKKKNKKKISKNKIKIPQNNRTSYKINSFQSPKLFCRLPLFLNIKIKKNHSLFF